jgi:hypothetical protein
MEWAVTLRNTTSNPPMSHRNEILQALTKLAIIFPDVRTLEK